jgi:hypothetical protein
VGLGFLFLLTRLGNKESRRPEAEHESSHFFREILPIVIIVVLSVTMGTILSLAARRWPIALILPDRAALAIALGVGVLWVWRKNRMTGSQELEILKSRKLWILIFTILGVMAFRQLLTDSGAVQGITQSLADRQMPMIAISIFLPFFVGMITGVTVAFLATTFPILMALISAQGLDSHTVAFTVLAYCSGFMGTFLSPVHLCLILTKEYFKADWAGIYKLILAPGILTIMSALGLYFLYLRLY